MLLEVALGLHLDDGFVTGQAEKMMEVFVNLEEKNCFETLTHHWSRKLCWSSEDYRRRTHVGERTGQVRIHHLC